jgi:hypothetical protein
MREARLRLQGMEDQFPCATWLPIICQNPAETPPNWSDWSGKSSSSTTGNPTPLRAEAWNGPDSGVVEEIYIRRTSSSRSAGDTRGSGNIRDSGSHRRGAAKTATREAPAPSRSLRQIRLSRKLKQLEQTRTQLTDFLQAGYHVLTVGMQVGITILQMVGLGGLGGCLGSAIGFWLIYWSPMSNDIAGWLYRSGVPLLPGFRANLEPAVLLFAIAGFATALGLGSARTLDRRPWMWTPLWMGSLGYALGWISWQLNPDSTISGALGLLGAIAAGLSILGLGLQEHPLAHGAIVAIGMRLTFIQLVNLSWFKIGSFILLLPEPKSIIVNFDDSLFWASLHFFTLFGSMLGLWLGISYFLALPGLYRLRSLWR